MHPEFKIMPSAAFASLVVNTYDNNSAHAFNAVSSSSTFVMMSLPFLSFSVPAKLQNRVAMIKSESATSGANALLAFDKLLEEDALFSSCPKTEKFTPSAFFSANRTAKCAKSAIESNSSSFAPSSPFIFFSKADRFAYSPNRNDFKIRFKHSFATISFGLTRNLERRQFIAAERISR